MPRTRINLLKMDHLVMTWLADLCQRKVIPDLTTQELWSRVSEAAGNLPLDVETKVMEAVKLSKEDFALLAKLGRSGVPVGGPGQPSTFERLFKLRLAVEDDGWIYPEPIGAHPVAQTLLGVDR